MNKLILSRGPQIDIQQCTQLVGGNKFELVLIAAQRARDLRKKNLDSKSNFILDSLLDLQNKKINPKEMLEKRAGYINKPTKKLYNARAKKVR